MKRNEKYLYRALRFVFKPLIHLVYRPEIIGREHIPSEGGAIIAGNHKHAFDPLLVDISTKRVVRTLAKKELHDGAFGFLFRGIGSIPVDLNSKGNSSALVAALQVLKEGELINVSPEAKRNFTDELLLSFKYGAVIMAKKTKSPIIPYAITGDYKLFSKNLKIVFGEPMEIGDMKLYEANKELYRRIMELLVSSMEKDVLQQKHITTYDEWDASERG